MRVTWQTELLLNEQSQLTSLNLLKPNVTLKFSALLQELELRFQCMLCSFKDIISRVRTVKKEKVLIFSQI